MRGPSDQSPGAGGPPPLAADPDAVEAAVAERLGTPVRRHETHGSIVFVGGDRAYKLRKPVHFDFADLRTLAVRRALARADRAAAEPLAPSIVLGTLDVVPAGPGQVALVDAAAGAPDAIDVVTEMQRYDDAHTLRARVVDGTATVDDCREIGAAVAAFHRAARRVTHAIDPRAMVDRNLEAVLPLVEPLLPARERFALQRFFDAFLTGWGTTLPARASAGLVVDGHGDLRAEHVVLEDRGVVIVDRLEFAELRAIDLSDELAFLRMELLDLTGDDALGDAVLDGYREAGGIVPPHALLAFFGVHRALVRAKVTLLRAAQLEHPASDDATSHAFHLLSVARRLVWRARGRRILLVTGPPASGKSTLAAAVADAAHAPLLSSDVLRPRDPESAAADYSPAGRARVYVELAEQAAAQEWCVVDATFGDEEVQRAFLAALPRERRRDVAVVACHAPMQERMERARRRALAGTSASDADERVVLQLGAWAPAPAFPFAPRLAIDTQVPLAAQVDLIESWLDAQLAASAD